MLKNSNKFNDFQLINYVFSNLQHIFLIESLHEPIPNKRRKL